MSDLVAPIVLGGGGKNHNGYASVRFIKGLPEQFVVEPVGSAGEDDDRASRRVIFTALGRPSCEEVTGIYLAGGKP